MKKIVSLRNFLREAVPYLKQNPDKLLVFVEIGSVNNRAGLASLSFAYSYTATIVITDFAGDPDRVIVPIVAWLKKNQPHRAGDKAFDLQAEILDNDCADLEIKVALDEFVNVTDNGNGTVSTDHLGETIYVGDFLPEDPLAEWETHNG